LAIETDWALSPLRTAFLERKADLLWRPLLGELQEQPKGIAIAGDGVRAGLALLHEPIHEEGLHESW
jgi:hypothetical protein